VIVFTFWNDSLRVSSRTGRQQDQSRQGFLVIMEDLDPGPGDDTPFLVSEDRAKMQFFSQVVDLTR
jgi:hypothetical protein